MERYQKLSKSALLEKIKYFKDTVDALVGEDATRLPSSLSIEYLGDWYWQVPKDKVVCNDKKILSLNYAKEDIPDHITHQFFTEKLHPDDYESVMDNMRQHLLGNTPYYEVQYKIRTKDGDWKWFYDRGKVTKRDAQGKPLLLVGIVLDITKEKEMSSLLLEQNELLANLVDIDHLTSVLNRRALYERLNFQIENAQLNKTDLFILMIDIDDFKIINDTYGHIVGDKVLKQVAHVIDNSIRKTDIVGRYGGEEFLIILPETDKKTCFSIAEEIRKNIEKLDSIQNHHITISGGIKQYDGESIDNIIHQADQKMYLAKRKGKNKIIIFDD